MISDDSDSDDDFVMHGFERAPRVVVPPAEQRIPENMVENEPVRPEEALDQPQEPQIVNPRDKPENPPVANIEIIREQGGVNQFFARARDAAAAALANFQGGGDFVNIAPGDADTAQRLLRAIDEDDLDTFDGNISRYQERMGVKTNNRLQCYIMLLKQRAETAVMNFQIRERRAREEARWAGRVAEIREFLREQRARLEQDRPRVNNGDNPEEEPPRRVRILGEGIPPMPRLPIQERLRRQGVEDPAQLRQMEERFRARVEERQALMMRHREIVMRDPERRRLEGQRLADRILTPPETPAHEIENCKINPESKIVKTLLNPAYFTPEVLELLVSFAAIHRILDPFLPLLSDSAWEGHSKATRRQVADKIFNFLFLSEKDESACIKSNTWEIFDLMRKADLVDYTKKIKLSNGQVEADFSTKYVHSLILAYEKSMQISQREIENDNQKRSVDVRGTGLPPRSFAEAQVTLWRKERKDAEKSIRGLVTILGSMLAIPDQFMSVTEELLIKMTASDGEETISYDHRVSLLEYLVERMSYTKSLKDYQLEDMGEIKDRLDMDEDLSLVAASNQYDLGIREVDRIRLRAQQARAQRKFEIYSSAEKQFADALDIILTRRLRTALNYRSDRDRSRQDQFYNMLRLVCTSKMRQNSLVRNAFILEAITAHR